MTFHEACRAIEANDKAPALTYAVGYARAGLTLDDPHAQRVQALYILNNITHWRGQLATEVRTTLKAFTNPKK